jgi:XTP/dITP diphosphohydrolase
VVLATRSEGKRRELAPLLASAGWDALTLDDMGVPETPEEDALEVFDTFEGNAIAKARWFVSRCGGLPVLADDSGLCVDALDGRPGVHSKRWSGRADLTGAALDAANNAFLLGALAQAAAQGNTSREGAYVCVVAWADDDGVRTARGESRGTLLAAPRGDGGFGYDPYFWSGELRMTFAEATREAKAAVSHRGRALRGLLGVSGEAKGA